MRVRIGNRLGIVKVGSSPVVAIEDDKAKNEVIISLEFGVDLAASLNNKIQIATINLYSEPIVNTRPIFSSENYYEGLLVATRFDSSEKSEVSVNRSERLISTAKVDITKMIPNDMIKSFSQGQRNSIKVFKTIGSQIALSDQTEFSIDQPESNSFIETEKFCFDSIRKGVDPILLKGSFPCVSPSLFFDKTIRKNSKKDFLNYKIVGQTKKYASGNIITRFSSCIAGIRISKNAVKSLSTLYGEIVLANNDGVFISSEKFIISTQEIEKDVKYLEESSSQPEKSYFARTIGRKDDEMQVPYSSLTRDSYIQSISKKNLVYKIFRTISGSRISTSKVKLPSASSLNARQLSNNLIPFSVERKGDAIQITCENIRNGIVSIGIEKRDATLLEKFKKQAGGSLDIQLVFRNSSARFIDTDVKNDHIYEYRLFFIDTSGNVYSTENTIFYHYASTQISQPASIKIENKIRDIIEAQSISYPVFSFDINASIEEAGAEVVKQFVLSNGLSFGDLGISENEYGAYRKLFIYEIERQNMRTGETESFGTIYEPRFIDDSASPSSLKTIKPLNLLDSYKYSVRLGLRDPSALVPLQNTKRTLPEGNKSFVSRSYKFGISPKKGILPSARKLSSKKSFSLLENFHDFSLGVEEIVTLNAEEYQPRISSISFRKTLLGFTVLEWSITGDYESVDHFRIYATADGVESHIGSAHPHIINGSYFYEDREMHNRLGEVVYRISPVLLNFKESPGSATVSVITELIAPTFER